MQEKSSGFAAVFYAILILTRNTICYTIRITTSIVNALMYNNA